MNDHNVFLHPNRGWLAVKLGFSWPAFFLGLLWLLAKGLWMQALVWFAALAGLVIIKLLAIEVDQIGDVVSGAIILAWLAAFVPLLLVPGAYGNGWVESKLEGEGATRVGCYPARSPADAVARARGRRDA